MKNIDGVAVTHALQFSREQNGVGVIARRKIFEELGCKLDGTMRFLLDRRLADRPRTQESFSHETPDGPSGLCVVGDIGDASGCERAPAEVQDGVADVIGHPGVESVSDHIVGGSELGWAQVANVGEGETDIGEAKSVGGLTGGGKVSGGTIDTGEGGFRE